MDRFHASGNADPITSGVWRPPRIGFAAAPPEPNLKIENVFRLGSNVAEASRASCPGSKSSTAPAPFGRRSSEPHRDHPADNQQRRAGTRTTEGFAEECDADDCREHDGTFPQCRDRANGRLCHRPDDDRVSAECVKPEPANDLADMP